MTVDRPFESFQDAGSSAQAIPTTSNSVPNELDGVFDFFQLEGKDAPQQVCQFYDPDIVPRCLIYYSCLF